MRLGTAGFVGERLKRAREARGMTAATLAELVEVSRQAIHQYENGPHSPGHDVLVRLAAALGVPLHHFLKQPRAANHGAFFARSMSAVTKAARLRARRLLERAEEMACEFDAIASLADVDLPDLGMPPDPLQLSMGDMEEAASRLRRAWGLEDGPISNITWLLENHGVVVVRAALEARTLDGISCWINGRPYILINEDVPLARFRFDLCHELAHLCLHRHVPEKALNSAPTFKLIEAQAHRFAAAFAFPQASFARESYPLSLDHFLDLKQRWKLSVKMMIHRAGDLQLAPPDFIATLYRRYNARKWTRAEPFDDVLPAEVPLMLSKAATLAVESGAVSAEDLLHAVGLTETEACALSSMRRKTFAQTHAEVLPFVRPSRPR